MLPNIFKNSKFKLSLLIILFFWSLFLSTGLIYAQVPQPATLDVQAGWKFDPQVTEIGKNAERARQLVYWLFTHPPTYTVPVFVRIWGISSSFVYALFILVIAVCGLGFIIARRSGTIGPIFSGIASPFFGMTLPNLFYKIVLLLIYITFSYSVVLGLIQLSEAFTKYFAEKYFGCDLFNIRFAGSGTSCELAPVQLEEMETNYTDFVGYRDTNILNQESANTSLFIVRLTSLTYNLFSFVLIARQVILWFLLMLSPFLAILLPFVFIRNTGWIWIGVFFQWLFYGPLVSLFLSGLVLIWRNGIPYAFDFTRRNQTNGQIFPTAINILYGGPAQVLTPTNSANYVDTYAEYIIALVMLWMVIFLPWLLLRIFRDYCCDILKQNQAAIVSLFDKLRGALPPSIPPSPLGPEGVSKTSMQLPFRKTVEEVEKSTLKRLQDISQANTFALTQSLSLGVSTLAEVARFDMHEKENEQVVRTLNKIANPNTVVVENERARFSHIQQELTNRAHMGDTAAQRVMTAAYNRQLTGVPLPVSREFPEINVREIINNISKETKLSTDKIKAVLSEIPKITVENRVETISKNLAIPQQQVQQVISSLPQFVPTGANLTQYISENPQVINDVVRATGLSFQQVESVIKEYTQTSLTYAEKLDKIALDIALTTDDVRKLLNALPDSIINFSPQILSQTSSNTYANEFIAKSSGVSSEKVTEVLNNVFKVTQENKQINKEELTDKVAVMSKIDKERVQSVISVASEVLPLTTPSAISTFISQSQIIKEISEKTELSEDKITDVLTTVSQITQENKQINKDELINKVATISNIDKEKVKNILNITSETVPLSSPNAISGLISQSQFIQQISQKADLSEDKVRKILQKIAEVSPKEEKIDDYASRIEQLAQEISVSLDEIKNLLEKLPDTLIKVYPQMFESIAESPEITSFIASQTLLSKDKVKQVLKAVTQSSKNISKDAKSPLYEIEYQKIAQMVGEKESVVKEVINSSAGKITELSPKMVAALTREPVVVEALKKQSGLPQKTITHILDRISQMTPIREQFEQQVEKVSEISGLSKDKVKAILGTVAAVNLEKPVMAQPAKHPTVSVEDYEEVKNMWGNHYRLSEVPISDSIQNREGWLKEDVQRLTNTLNLLTSLNPKDRERGMKEIATILPFLLLGGFSETETVIYLKAKLQAAKEVLTQLEEKEKIKEEVLKEEEETLVEAPREEKKEEEKTFEAEEKKEQQLPDEQKEENVSVDEKEKKIDSINNSDSNSKADITTELKKENK